MKYLITIILAFLIQFSNAQMSGIPEQDSLLELKDKLYLKYKDFGISINPEPMPDEYLWVEYQWLQWVKGKKQRFCIYKIYGSQNHIYSLECPKEFNGIILINQTYIGDTLIHVPKPISYEGFMNWKIENALKE